MGIFKKQYIYILFLLPILCWSSIYFFQEKLIFKPTKLTSDFQYQFDQHFLEKYFSVEGKIEIHGLLFPSIEKKGVILSLHGNSGKLNNIGYSSFIYTDLGYDVLFLNYRGFGKSDGSIESEKQLLNDAQIVYDDLKKEYGEENIIILGTSVGTGIGSFLASKNSPKKLILVAPYSNFKVLQKEKIKFVPDFIFRYELNSNDFLEGVRCPIIIFHGKKDQRIPFYHAERLKSNHEKIKLISFENYNHVDFLKESIYLNEIEKLLK